MKAEINNENKAKFFSLYLGQKVAGHECDKDNFELTEISILDCEVGLWGDWSGGTHPQTSQNDMIGIGDVWINLKSLSDISDENAIMCYDILYSGTKWPDDYKIKEIKSWLNDEYGIGTIKHKWAVGNVFNFLRSSSYLVQWMGLSCEEIIEAGWAKYKE